MLQKAKVLQLIEIYLYEISPLIPMLKTLKAKMTKQILLTVVVKEEEKGYSVICPELNVASQGETFEETISNIKEAIELYIESAEQLGIIDEVLEQLGISKEDFEKDKILPKIVTANVPIEIAI